jgi:hypothetical protein
MNLAPSGVPGGLLRAMSPCANPPIPANATPNPTESTESPNVVSGEIRNVFCFHYDRCLDDVVRRGWANWSCQRCALVDATKPPSATRFANDRPRNRE